MKRKLTAALVLSLALGAWASAQFARNAAPGGGTTLNDGLEGYWRLANDPNDSLSLNNLTNSGVTFDGDAATFSAARLSHTINATFQTGDIDFTWALELQPDVTAAASSGVVSVYNGATSNASWAWFTPTPTTINVAGVNGTTQTVGTATGSVLSTSAFRLAVFWRTAADNHFWVSVNDGAAHDFGDIGTINLGNTDFYVGQLNVGPISWAGKMRRLAYWKRALTSDERTELYNGGTVLTYPF